MINSVRLINNVEEKIMDIIQIAEDNNKTIEAINPSFRNLLKEIYNLFHSDMIKSGPDEEGLNNEKILKLLNIYLTKNKNEYIYEYSKNSLPDMSSSEVITSIFLLLISEKLFSFFFLYLMSLPEMKELYNSNSVIMNVEFLGKIIKKFQFFEFKNLNIESKWISHYNLNKIEKKNMDLNNKSLKLDILKKKEKTFLEINKDFFDSLKEDDPIKKWYREKDSLDLTDIKKLGPKKESLENKEIERNFLKSKISDIDGNVNVEANLPSPRKLKGENQLFKILQEELKNKMKKEKKQEEKIISEDEIKKVEEKKIQPSKMIYDKIKDTIKESHFLLKKNDEKFKSKNCEICEKEFKNNFFNVK